MDALNDFWSTDGTTDNADDYAYILGWAANEFGSTLDYNELEDIMNLLTL